MTTSMNAGSLSVAQMVKDWIDWADRVEGKSIEIGIIRGTSVLSKSIMNVD